MRGSLTFIWFNCVCSSCGRREDTTRKEADAGRCGDRVGPDILFLFDSTCILKTPAEILRVLMYNHFLRYQFGSNLQSTVCFIHWLPFRRILLDLQSFDSDRSHLAFIDALDGFQWFACWRITGEWGSTVSILFLAICIIQFSQSAFFPLESGRWPSQIGRLQPISD